MSLRHHSLIAWQRADDLFIKVHRLTFESFPSCERFELSSQLRRAAYSVPANIVEGFARRYRRSRLHFLNISESSLAEVGYCIHCGKKAQVHQSGYARRTGARDQRGICAAGRIDQIDQTPSSRHLGDCGLGKHVTLALAVVLKTRPTCLTRPTRPHRPHPHYRAGSEVYATTAIFQPAGSRTSVN